MRLRSVLVFALLCCVYAMAQDYKWQTSLVIKGSGVMQSEQRDFLGSKWRVRYTTKDYSPMRIELLKADGSLAKTLVAATNRQALSGSNSGSFPAGLSKGFLRVKGAMDGWQVILEQYVDDIKGWKLASLEKKKANMQKIGAWSGEENGNMEIPLIVDGAACRLSLKALISGRLKVQVLDASNQEVMVTCLTQAGQQECWLYGAGKYTVRVSALSMTWVMEADELLQE